MTILLFCREIYAQSWLRRALVYKNRAITFRMTILFFCGEIYAQSQPRRVLVYKNYATTFRIAILFFCREIYAYSWPNRVLVYKNSATNFRITILFFSREIYAQSWPRRVLVYKNRAITFRMTILQKYMLSLGQGVFQCTLRNIATTFRIAILFFCREIYAYSWPRQKQCDYLSNDNLILLLYAQSQPI